MHFGVVRLDWARHAVERLDLAFSAWDKGVAAPRQEFGGQRERAVAQ